MGRGDTVLTHEELNLIDLLRLKTLSKDVFRNCLIITMSHFGDTIGHIAERLGCSTETVVRIRREYRERGLDALKPEKPPGRSSRATQNLTFRTSARDYPGISSGGKSLRRVGYRERVGRRSTSRNP